jgi:hypothetical protein
MSEFILQPSVYTTGRSQNLLQLLEEIWINKVKEKCDYNIFSGFGNYNGGVRFYSVFKRHIDNGGKVTAFFGGSTSQKLASKQLVERMLQIGCEINIVNRKRLFHTKLYGTQYGKDNFLVITSGNFTGPGLSHNVESSIYLKNDITSKIGFDWIDLKKSVLKQNWDIYVPVLSDMESPAWKLLYDEKQEQVLVDDTQLMTMVLILGHADTVRIMASPGSTEGQGSQYFWLSKDCFDFFPPLTIFNERGYKTTNSCLVNLYYKDMGKVKYDSRVTFEAGNNVDFRLGTGKFRYTKIAKQGDMALVTRLSEYNYMIKIIKQDNILYEKLKPYATTFIGHQGKMIGYITNERLKQEIDYYIPEKKEFELLPRF